MTLQNIKKLVIAFGLSSFCAMSFAADEAVVADANKGKTYAESVCVACHGVEGNGVDPNAPVTMYPLIAGQHAEYIAKQLKDFVGVGDQPAARHNDIMSPMAKAVPAEDIVHVAAWFAKQKINPSKATADAAVLKAGEQLWRFGNAKKGIPACAGCHGQEGHGLPAQYPSLAGQYPEYTESQLKLFRSGERANGPMMRVIAEKMSDKEIQAVSQYAAGLR